MIILEGKSASYKLWIIKPDLSDDRQNITDELWSETWTHGKRRCGGVAVKSMNLRKLKCWCTSEGFVPPSSILKNTMVSLKYSVLKMSGLGKGRRKSVNIQIQASHVISTQVKLQNLLRTDSWMLQLSLSMKRLENIQPLSAAYRQLLLFSSVRVLPLLMANLFRVVFSEFMISQLKSTAKYYSLHLKLLRLSRFHDPNTIFESWRPSYRLTGFAGLPCTTELRHSQTSNTWFSLFSDVLLAHPNAPFYDNEVDCLLLSAAVFPISLHGSWGVAAGWRSYPIYIELTNIGRKSVLAAHALQFWYQILKGCNR